MSALHSQLTTLRRGQPCLHAPAQVCLLFDSKSSLQMIYSLARSSPISATADPLLCLLLDQQHYQLNRSQLLADQNSRLSTTLQQALIQMSPYFLFPHCQHVLQYLLRNFQVHLFESQVLTLAYLQHWQSPLYAKLLTQVPAPATLSIPHDIKSIVRTLRSSPRLLTTLLKCAKGYRGEYCKGDPKVFLMQIFKEMVRCSANAVYKDITHFLLAMDNRNAVLNSSAVELIMLMLEQRALTQNVQKVLFCRYYGEEGLQFVLRGVQRNIVSGTIIQEVERHQIHEGCIKGYQGDLALVVRNISNALANSALVRVINQYLGRSKQAKSSKRQQQSQKQEQQNTTNYYNSTLSMLIQSDGMTLDLDNTEVIQRCGYYVRQYYDGGDKRISEKQKQYIIQRVPTLYKLEYLNRDLQSKEYITILKYFESKLSPEAKLSIVKQCLVKCCFTCNITYEKMIGKSIEILSMQSSYKSIISVLNAVFRDYIKNCTDEDTVEHSVKQRIVNTNALMLKISRNVFGRLKLRKGKYYKIIQYHCIMLSKVMERSRSQAKQCYVQLYTIFKKDLYLINVGLSYLLLKSNNSLQSTTFLTRQIIMACLKQQTFTISELSTSLQQMLLLHRQFQTKAFTKKVFMSCHHPTSVSQMQKKIIIFINVLCSGPQFHKVFKSSLQQCSANEPQQLHHLLATYSCICKLVVDLPLTTLQIVISLFPLQTRINLLYPLLPNTTLYTYLAKELSTHNAQLTAFEVLQQAIDIPPEQITLPYLHFFTECLKRNIAPSDLQPLIHMESQFMSQLLCQTAQYCPHKLYPYTHKCIEVVSKVVSLHTPYSIAVAYVVITSLKEVIHPYIQHIFLQVINGCEGYQQLDQFLVGVAQSLSPSTLISLIKQTYASIINYTKYTLFWQRVAERDTGDTLLKPFLSYSLNCLHRSQDLLPTTEELSEVMRITAMKLNQNQLRRVIIELTRWAQLSTHQLSTKKLLLLSIYCTLSDSLQQLFTPFFGYIFDSILQDLGAEPQSRTHQLYLGKALTALTNLFTHDSERLFLDGVKFDELAEQLSALFVRGEHKELTQCALALCAYTNDDYQLKAFNYKILLLVKRAQDYVLHFQELLIDLLQERFLVLVNDVVPFLLQASKSRNPKVVATVQSIIRKIQDLSGDKIQNYVR